MAVFEGGLTTFISWRLLSLIIKWRDCLWARFARMFQADIVICICLSRPVTDTDEFHHALVIISLIDEVIFSWMSYSRFPPLIWVLLPVSKCKAIGRTSFNSLYKISASVFLYAISRYDFLRVLKRHSFSERSVLIPYCQVRLQVYDILY